MSTKRNDLEATLPKEKHVLRVITNQLRVRLLCKNSSIKIQKRLISLMWRSSIMRPSHGGFGYDCWRYTFCSFANKINPKKVSYLVSSGDFGVEDKKSQKRRLLCWRDWSLRGRKLMNQQDWVSEVWMKRWEPVNFVLSRHDHPLPCVRYSQYLIIWFLWKMNCSLWICFYNMHKLVSDWDLP